MKAKLFIVLGLLVLLASCDISFLFGSLSNGTYTRETRDIKETFVLTDEGFTLKRVLLSDNSTLREFSGTFSSKENVDDNVTRYYLSSFESNMDYAVHDSTRPQLMLTYNSPTLVVQIDVNADGEFVTNDLSDVYVSLE